MAESRANPAVRCLYLHDTFELIVRALVSDKKKHSVANLAATNKWLSSMTLPLLWEWLDGLEPLLNLLPGDKFRDLLDTTDTDAVPPNVANALRLANVSVDPVGLSAVRRYASYIKCFCWVCFCNVCMRGCELLCSSEDRLFPRLRSMTFFGISAPFLYRGKDGLEHRSRAQDVPQNGWPTAEIMGSFLKQCDPNRLEALGLPCLRHADESNPDITGVDLSHPALAVIKSFPRLRAFNYPVPLRAAEFATLGCLAIRDTIWIVNPEPGGAAQPQHSLGGFCMLEELMVILPLDGASCLPLLGAFRFPKLQTAGIHVNIQKVTATTVLAAISCLPWSTNLTRLLIQMNYPPFMEVGPIPVGTVTSTDMQHLLGLTRLTYLVVYAQRFELDADFSVDLAQAMPRLMYLALQQYDHSDDAPCLPVTALLPLAEHCRHLCDLNIDIEASDAEYSIPQDFLPQMALYSLYIGRGRVQHPEEAAAYLNVLFPSLLTLGYEADVVTAQTNLPSASLTGLTPHDADPSKAPGESSWKAVGNILRSRCTQSCHCPRHSKQNAGGRRMFTGGPGKHEGGLVW